MLLSLINLNFLSSQGLFIAALRHFSRFFLFLLFFFLSFVNNSYCAPISNILWHELDDSQIEYLKKSYKLAQEKKYDEALNLAIQLQNDIEKSVSTNKNNNKNSFAQAISDLILWKKFSDEKIDFNKTSFSDISRFAIDNPFYPNHKQIKKNVEQLIIAKNISLELSNQYFLVNPASDTDSRIYFINSKIDYLSRNNSNNQNRENDVKEVQNLIAKSWENENFSAAQESVFLEKYQNQLTSKNHATRLERLLFEGRISDAKRVLKFLDSDYEELVLAIEKIQDLPRNIDAIIARIPRYLRKSEVLIYRRILWHKARSEVDELVELMLDLPKDSKFAENWWSLRKLYGRELLKQKEYKNSYQLLANHGLKTDSANFWEAEWSAGFVSLRFLNKGAIAYNHFEKLFKNVSQPVTLSRASYWLGMAAEKLGDKELAISWYKNAAKYPVFFYGQLAIHKHRLLDPIAAKNDIILPKDPDVTGRDIHNISNMKAAQIAYLLKIIGEDAASAKIFHYIIENSATEGQIAVVMKIVDEFNDKAMDVSLSRVAARKNVFFIKDKFQIVDEVKNDEFAPLIHAIIKQESGFMPSALSKVGAIGYMQIMPETAKLVAKEAGVPYNKKKLARDINYNIKLGSFYIKKLIDMFEGSEMLAIASYNAGPNATKRWINEFYDPRETSDIDKVVDWIELITYSETRNYVQRIMENLIVYKYLMSRQNYDEIK
jgi:soluble lytic murein transglycosylase